MMNSEALDGEVAKTALTCTGCGGRLEAAPARPLVRCAVCGALGYPDRAGQYLTALAWTCTACGGWNDGAHNFCLGCGAGLASRCVRCGAPVYSAFCTACGAHQARAQRFRAEVRYRVDGAEPRPLTPQERAARAEAAAGSNWHGLDRRWRRAARRRARQWRGLQRGWLLWLALLLVSVIAWQVGGIWPAVIWGVGALLWGPSPNRVRRAFAIVLMAVAAGWLGSRYFPFVEESLLRPLAAGATGLAARFEREVGPAVVAWWGRFQATLPRLRTLTREDPAYAALFGTIAFSLTVLPVGIYLIDRLVRRLFRE